MASAPVQPVDVVPRVFTHAPIASGASHVAQYRKREFPPESFGPYAPGGATEMRFHISSNTDFMDGKSTYLRMVVATTGTWDSSTNDFKRHFSEGGIKNFIKKLEITDNAGRQIELIDQYAILSNIVSTLYHPKNHISSNEFVSGDGIPGEYIWTSVGTTGAWMSGDDIDLIRTTADYRNFLAVGDTIKLTDGCRDVTGELQVVDITALDMKVTPAMGVDYDYGAARVILVKRTNSELATYPSNTDINSSSKVYVLNIRLDSGFLSILEDIPLFLMDGLKLRIELNDAVRVIKNSCPEGNLDANATVNYQIRQPRLVTRLRTPSEDIRAQYFELVQRGDLNYAFPGYYYFAKQQMSSGGNMDINLPIAKSAVRRAFFVLQSDAAINTGATTSVLTNPLTYPEHRFTDGKLSAYQYRLGGVDYPTLPVDCSDDYMTEAYQELLISFGLHNNVQSMPRMEWSKWIKKNQGGGNIATYDESHKAIFATTFATLQSDPLSGIKTVGPGTDSHIIASLTFSTQYGFGGDIGNLNYRFWFEYTKILAFRRGTILVIE